MKTLKVAEIDENQGLGNELYETSLSPSLNTYITIASGATFTLNPSASMTQGRFTNNGTMDIYGSYTAYYMTNNSGGVLNIKSGGSYSCPACAETFSAGSFINNTGTMHAGTGSTWQSIVRQRFVLTVLQRRQHKGLPEWGLDAGWVNCSVVGQFDNA